LIKKSAPACPLDAIHVELIEGGAGMFVASRDQRMIPSMSWVLACRIGEMRDTLTLILNRSESAALLADVRRSGVVSAVFSVPSTHQTIQVKGSLLGIREAEPQDVEAIERATRAFADDLAPLGFGFEYAACLNTVETGGLVALQYRVEQVYDQTPGATAGQLVAGAYASA